MQSADRALAILASFDEDRLQIRVSEFAGRLDMHKSTVSRLLATLESRGLVRRDGERFSPGPELARLGGLALRGLTLVDVAQEPLTSLAEQTGETVNLAVRQGDDALNVHQVESSHFISIDWRGRLTPLHCTANGKALLAFDDDDDDGGLPAELPALTRHTITKPAALQVELECVRTRGYAVAVEELEVGLHAVAAPVFDASGRCVAAVSVAGPSFRLPEARLAELGERCVTASDQISTALGSGARRPLSSSNQRRSAPCP